MRWRRLVVFLPQDPQSSPPVTSVQGNDLHVPQWKVDSGTAKRLMDTCICLPEICFLLQTSLPDIPWRAPSLPHVLGEPDPATISGKWLVTLA